jgi:restriction endonuclease Mrr
LANRELDRFVTNWNVSGLAPLFSEDKLINLKRHLKVRTRHFLTQIDSIKDQCYEEKDACANRFRDAVKTVPFYELLEEQDETFKKILNETNHRTGYKKVDDMIIDLEKKMNEA